MRPDGQNHGGGFRFAAMEQTWHAVERRLDGTVGPRWPVPGAVGGLGRGIL